jgi:hypothetical protein
VFADRLADVIETRARRPELVAEAADRRPRAPSFLSPGGTLVLIAADHTARGTLRAGRLMTAMADRTGLLERICVALARPGVDGVLGSADVLEDLLLLGALDGKVVIGSMNRGGLADTVFEIDDRFTGYDAPAIARMGFDAGKMLLRIDPDDPATAATLQACAHAVSDLAARRLVAMIEPFISHRVEGRVRNDLSPEAMMRAIAVASGLGTTSAYTWLKVPVVPDMERVMAASTLPALLLGGEVPDDPESAYAGWRKALRLPNVKGLVAGRSLLYPADDDVATAVDTAVSLLLSGGPAAAPGQPDAEAGRGELEQHRTGRHQGRDLGRAELLELGQNLGVGVRALAARPAQRDRVGPHLLACLAQEALGTKPVERAQQPVHERARAGDLGQLVVLGGDPGGEYGVDGLVIGLPALQEGWIVELLVGDHRQQRLGQVEVDVGVHAEQYVAQRGQVGRRPERDRPGPRRLTSGQRGLERIEVEVGERDVPSFNPFGVDEAAALEFLGNRDRGALVGRVEEAPRVAGGLQRLEQGGHPADQLLDHGQGSPMVAAWVTSSESGGTRSTPSGSLR